MFVTGLPGSGTTWVFAVLQAAGLDGGDDVFWASDRKGGEFDPLRRYSLGMIRTLLGHHEPVSSPWPFDGEKRAAYLAEFPPPDIPDLVKVPDWGVCRLYEEYEHTSLLVVRPMDDWLASVDRSRRTLTVPHDRLRDGAEAAISRMRETADLVLEWPRALHDPAYMSRTVGFDVSAGMHVTNPEWVSFG